MSYLGDLVVILSVAVLAVLGLRRIGVPPVAGLVFAGVVLGPGGAGLVASRGHTETLAEVGVALLLFAVGLELTPPKLRKLIRPVFVGGALQVAICGAVVALGGWALGIGLGLSVFLGMVVALSSTAIVLRDLTRRGALSQPYGRLSLGALVFQDLCVVPLVLIVPLLGSGAVDPTAATLALLGKTVALVALVLATRWLLPRVFGWVAAARERELFVLVSVLACLGTAWAAQLAGASLAVGAFLGGVAIAGSEFRHQTLADVVPLREVLASLFFVSVGMLVEPALLWRDPTSVVSLLLVFVVAKGVLVFGALKLGGWRTGACLAGAAALAHVGEFSFVLAQEGRRWEVIPPDQEAPLFTAIGMSMLVAPFLLRAAPALEKRRFEKDEEGEHEIPPVAPDAEKVVVCGYGPTGRAVVRRLQDRALAVTVVDLNPQNVTQARKDGVRALYGDATDLTVLEQAGVPDASATVVSINDVGATERAVRAVRKIAPTTELTVRATYDVEVERLMAAGASHVISAEALSALEVAGVVSKQLP